MADTDAMTEREVRLMLTIVQLEEQNAALILKNWDSIEEAGYEDGAEALMREQEYARGYAAGASHLATLVRSIVNV